MPSSESGDIACGIALASGETGESPIGAGPASSMTRGLLTDPGEPLAEARLKLWKRVGVGSTIKADPKLVVDWFVGA